jgi:hypothetical protein
MRDFGVGGSQDRPCDALSNTNTSSGIVRSEGRKPPSDLFTRSSATSRCLARLSSSDALLSSPAVLRVSFQIAALRFPLATRHVGSSQRLLPPPLAPACEPTCRLLRFLRHDGPPVWNVPNVRLSSGVQPPRPRGLHAARVPGRTLLIPVPCLSCAMLNLGAAKRLLTPPLSPACQPTGCLFLVVLHDGPPVLPARPAACTSTPVFVIGAALVLVHAVRDLARANRFLTPPLTPTR